MPSIPCFCDHTIPTGRIPLLNGVNILRETAFVEAIAAARDLIATRPLDEDLEMPVISGCLSAPGNPAGRLSAQCPHCGRLHVTGDTWSSVQIFRPDTAAIPAGVAGRGATGLFGYPPPETTTESAVSAVTCPCGQHLDVTTRPHPRGLAIWSDLTESDAYGVFGHALEDGVGRDELARRLFEETLSFANPELRYALQCPTCARLLLLNDSNQVSYVFADNPDHDDPLEIYGRGWKGLFDDSDIAPSWAWHDEDTGAYILDVEAGWYDRARVNDLLTRLGDEVKKYTRIDVRGSDDRGDFYYQYTHDTDRTNDP